MANMTKEKALRWLRRNVSFTFGNERETFHYCLSVLSNDQPCERCAEWEKAWNALKHFLVPSLDQTGRFESIQNIVVLRKMDNIDPRRSSKPLMPNEFTSRDWLWG